MKPTFWQRLACACLGHRFRMSRAREGILRIGGFACRRCGYMRVRVWAVGASRTEILRILAALDQWEAAHPGLVHTPSRRRRLG